MDTDPSDGRQDAGDPATAGGEAGPRATSPSPLVGLVLVAHDPGDWFEEVLTAVGVQDHHDLEVLVVDAGHRAGLAERVAGILPWAEVVEAPNTPGFGAAANVVRGRERRAAFHLFMHDDLVLDGTAVRRLVECALEVNAGVVGPKVLDGADPRYLEDMGCWVDRYGGGVPRFEASLGDLVDIVVTSDVDDEVHLHAYDMTVDVEAGGEATFRVEATIPGVFEAELHDAGFRIFELQVS